VIHTNSTYEAEKIFQYRLSEFDRNTRDGLYVKPITPKQGAAFDQAGKHRGFWHKWFGGRRLDTSVK
jgi:hypothetical protein